MCNTCIHILVFQIGEIWKFSESLYGNPVFCPGFRDPKSFKIIVHLQYQIKIKSQDKVVHAYNPSNWYIEAGRCL